MRELCDPIAGKKHDQFRSCYALLRQHNDCAPLVVSEGFGGPTIAAACEPYSAIGSPNTCRGAARGESLQAT